MSKLNTNNKKLNNIFFFRTDNNFLEPIKENVPEDLELTERISLALKLLPAFTETDQICEPFTGFSISNWDPENEDV